MFKLKLQYIEIRSPVSVQPNNFVMFCIPMYRSYNSISRVSFLHVIQIESLLDDDASSLTSSQFPEIEEFSLYLVKIVGAIPFSKTLEMHVSGLMLLFVVPSSQLQAAAVNRHRIHYVYDNHSCIFIQG
jgi:hypothetical protein